jgi:hypothetical protein
MTNWQTDTITETAELLRALEELRHAATRPCESTAARERATDSALVHVENVRRAHGNSHS